MAISVTCHSCGREYSVKDEAAGKKFKCKDCGEVVDVPGASGSDSVEDDLGGPYDPYADGLDAGGAPPPVAARRPNRKRGGSKAAAGDRLKLPAIFMIIVVCLSFVYNFLNLAANLLGFGQDNPFMAQQQQLDPSAQLAFAIAWFVFCLVANSLVLIGSISMLRVGSYGLAMTAAIVSVIPCASPCCIFGIPFGIWALVVLNDDAVKAGFR